MFNIYIIHWKLFAVTLITVITKFTNATQSVYSCPLEAFGTGVGLQSRSLFASRLGYPSGITDM